MSDAKVSALTAAAALTGLEQVPLVQTGATVRSTVSDVRNSAGEPLTFALQSGTQSSPGAGKAKVFCRNKAGRATLEIQGGSTGEIDTAFQPALFGNSISEFWPSTGTTLTGRGVPWTSNGGTIATPALSSVNKRTQMRRITGTTGISSSIGTGLRTTTGIVWRGNASELGGFFAFFRFALGLSGGLLGHRAFVGLTAQTTALAGDPSAMVNMIGVGFDAADAVILGWHLMTNDASGTATKTNYSAAARDNVASVFDLTLYAPPNGSSITVRLFDQTAQSVVIDNVAVTTDLPANTAFLCPQAGYQNGTSGTSGEINVAQIYVESDL
jgi:hypothetical protein